MALPDVTPEDHAMRRLLATLDAALAALRDADWNALSASYTREQWRQHSAILALARETAS